MRKLDKIKAEINTNGLARGWHAQQLERKANTKGVTMSDIFKMEREGTIAFSVPATLETLTRTKAVYRFMDGSTIELSPPNRVFQ
jgi:hypothetical protein